MNSIESKFENYNNSDKNGDSQKEPRFAMEFSKKIDIEGNADKNVEAKEIEVRLSPETPFPAGRIYVIFHRHGEHIILPSIPEREHPLTETGYREMKELGEEIQALEGQTIGFHADNLRSLLSDIVVMNPSVSATEAENIKKKYIKSGRIKPLKVLQYKELADEAFKEGLHEAVNRKAVFRFLVYESNTLAGANIDKLSTYSSISSEIAAILKKYIGVAPRWGKLSEKYDHKNLYRLFCGREFIYACFRAKLTERLLGIEARNGYVEWYENTVENGPIVRKIPNTIEISTDKDGLVNVLLKDQFGELKISMQALDEILGEGGDVETIASYCIPIRKNSVSGSWEVALVQYPDGFGFIGGRIEKGESATSGLSREIKEELGEDVEIDSKEMKRIKKPYSFIMSETGRPGEKKHPETHIFFLIELKRDQKLNFQESGASIVWLPNEELLSEKVIKHGEMRSYLEKEILPLIK